MNISDLASLNKKALCHEWVRLFKCEAPNPVHESFLRQAIGYQLQVNQMGGLGAVDQQYLKNGQASSLSHAGVRTRLIRVWGNQTHHVTVLKDGYLYQDRTWKSLSAIARAITGTPWSGPKFFGIKKDAKS